MAEGEEALLAVRETKKVRRWPLVALVGMQVATMGFVFFTLRYEDWFRYCWFQFGLLSAKNIRLSGTIHLSLDKLHLLLCDPTNDYYDTTTYYCPDFCVRMEAVERGSGILLFFIVLSVATATISLILHVFKALHLTFQLKYARLVTVLPFISLLVGAIVYVSVTGFGLYENVVTTRLCKGDVPLNLDMSLGSLFALVLLIAQLLTSLFGFQCSGKEFRKTVLRPLPPPAP